MIRAYNELYLSDAKKTLASMFDYAVNDCKYDIDWFAELFVNSGYARHFEIGNAAVIAGLSGIELAKRVLEYVYLSAPESSGAQPVDRTPEYWAGWAIADYQWYSSSRFSDIFDRVKMSEIVEMYSIYHEMDITQFRDEMDNRMNRVLPETKLKQIREANGLSQSELAKLSGVSLRSIQMYEQRKNDIDKAQGQTLYKLSAVLACQIEDLLEQPNK